MSSRHEQILREVPDEVDAAVSLNGVVLTFRRWLDEDRLLLSLMGIWIVAPGVSGAIRMWLLESDPTLMFCGGVALTGMYLFLLIITTNLLSVFSSLRMPQTTSKNKGNKGTVLITTGPILVIFFPLLFVLFPAHALFVGWGLWLPANLFTGPGPSLGMVLGGSLILIVLILVSCLSISFHRPRLKLTTTSLTMGRKLWELEGLQVTSSGQRVFLNGRRVSLLDGLLVEEQEWLCQLLEAACQRREKVLVDAGHNLEDEAKIPEALHTLQQRDR